MAKTRPYMVRGALLALGSLAMCTIAVVSAKAAVIQPTLTGEELFGTPIITSANCTPDGPSSFTYTVSGMALGPYPGEFTEVGRVETLGFPRAPVLSFQAAFTITPDPLDPNATFRRIVGAKTIGDPTAGEADCASVDVTGERFSLFVSHRYTAVIERPDGSTCSDRGVGAIQMLILDGPEPIAEFREDFFSDFTFTTGQADCGGSGEDDDDDDDDDD